jgi:hypothetical protein
MTRERLHAQQLRPFPKNFCLDIISWNRYAYTGVVDTI